MLAARVTARARLGSVLAASRAVVRAPVPVQMAERSIVSRVCDAVASDDWRRATSARRAGSFAPWQPFTRALATETGKAASSDGEAGSSGAEGASDRSDDGDAAGSSGANTDKEGESANDEQEEDSDARYEQQEQMPIWQVVGVLGALGLALWFGSYTVAELIPTATAPQSVRQRAFSALQGDPEVNERFGRVVRSYGAGYGSERGRRNFVQHYTYKERGEQFTRIKFMVETEDKQRATVFAEVKHSDPRKWSYLMVDPLGATESGRRRSRRRRRDVIVVEENRRPVKPMPVRQSDIVSRMLTSGSKLYYGGATDSFGKGQLARLGSAMSDSMRKALVVDCSRSENEQRCEAVGYGKGVSPLWEFRRGATTTTSKSKVLELSDLEEKLGIDN